MAVSSNINTINNNLILELDRESISDSNISLPNACYSLPQSLPTHNIIPDEHENYSLMHVNCRSLQKKF